MTSWIGLHHNPILSHNLILGVVVVFISPTPTSHNVCIVGKGTSITQKRKRKKENRKKKERNNYKD